MKHQRTNAPTLQRSGDVNWIRLFLRPTLTLLITVLFSVTLFPQELFVIDNGEETILQQHQKDMRDSFLAGPYYTEYDFILINHLPTLQESGQITFEIPGRPGDLTASAYYVDYRDSIDYVWFGKILNHEPGYLMIIRDTFGTAGYVQTVDDFYSIFPVQFEYAMIFRHAYEAWNILECGNIMDSGLPGQEPEVDICDAGFNACPAVIDVLALISAPARTWLDQFRFVQNLGGWPSQFVVRDLSPIILRAFETTANISLLLSDIPNKRFRFRHEDFQFVFTNNPIDLAMDVENLANGIGGNAPDRRAVTRSDIVIMYTDQGYPNGVVGRVAEIGPDTDLAYGISELRFNLAPRWTLAHEMAHLFGSRHNRSANVPCFNCGDDTNICAHGWRFNGLDMLDRRTIMARSDALNATDPQRRLLNFSNPDVQVAGVASGTQDDNNARVLRNSGCFVSEFLPDPGFNAFIVSTHAACPGSLVAMGAFITQPAPGFPGTPPYTFEWRWNTTGIFHPLDPGTFIGNDQNETLVYPSGVDQVFLQLQLRTSDNLLFIYTHHIATIPPEHCPIPFISLPEEGIAAQADYPELEVFPNPSDGTRIRCMYTGASDELVAFHLYNSLGQVVQHGIYKSAEIHEFSPVPAGHYYLFVEDKAGHCVQNIIVLD